MQPRKVQVDDQARACPRCGLPSARLKRLDHYISLFFIPLIPIKRGGTFLECSRCGGVFDETGYPQPSPFEFQAPLACPSCGRPVGPEFRYCPNCGQRIQ
ncbi:MAG: zinc ribbon domain-containing protein [Syntrophaceae bacterium]|nr:zinc ribbon domain-containing protein [Syntrophaceae bacterium]